MLNLYGNSMGPSVKFSPIEFPFEALIEICEIKAKLL